MLAVADEHYEYQVHPTPGLITALLKLLSRIVIASIASIASITIDSIAGYVSITRITSYVSITKIVSIASYLITT